MNTYERLSGAEHVVRLTSQRGQDQPERTATRVEHICVALGRLRDALDDQEGVVRDLVPGKDTSEKVPPGSDEVGTMPALADLLVRLPVVCEGFRERIVAATGRLRDGLC